MATLEEYSNKINMYKIKRKKLLALHNEILDCIHAINAARKYTDNIIVTGKSIDEEVLTEITNNLQDLYSSKIGPIVKDCNIKITYYQSQYNALYSRLENPIKELKNERM